MPVATDALCLAVVAALWGGTNPLIKKAGKGIDKIHRQTAISQFLAELHFLMFNWRYMAAFLLNQSGSVLFYVSLASADLSLAVPLANSLTFVFTTVSSLALGERIRKETWVGALFVAAGVALCVCSKLQTEAPTTLRTSTTPAASRSQ